MKPIGKSIDVIRGRPATQASYGNRVIQVCVEHLQPQIVLGGGRFSMPVSGTKTAKNFEAVLTRRPAPSDSFFRSAKPGKLCVEEGDCLSRSCHGRHRGCHRSRQGRRQKGTPRSCVTSVGPTAACAQAACFLQRLIKKNLGMAVHVLWDHHTFALCARTSKARMRLRLRYMRTKGDGSANDETS